MKHKLGIYLMLLFAGLANAADETPRNAYFGDLHIHTRYSFDAFSVSYTHLTLPTIYSV